MRMLGAVLALVGLLGLPAAHAAGPADSPTWQDPSTGLTWARCPLGYAFDAGQCDAGSEEQVSKTWSAGVQAADSLALYGFDDWRMPTIAEISTVYKCRYAKGTEDEGMYKQAKQYGWIKPDQFGYVSGCTELASVQSPSFDPAVFPLKMPSFSITFWAADGYNENDAVQFWETQRRLGSRTDTARVLLVRGGTPSDAYADALQDAAAGQAKVVSDAEDRKAEFAKQKAADEKRAAEERAFNQAQANKKQAQAKRTAELRKSAKAGDKTAQGLVLEVKGPLVKVQGYERVCTSRSNDRDPRSLCLRWKEVPTAVGWVKKSELRAPE